jgi:glycosyltransferase involved in cell wall biosynthesis
MLFRPFTRAALRRVEGVVFVSESTRKDAEALVANAGQVRMVTPHGVAGEGFLRPSEERVKEALMKLDVHAPYLLFVGTVEPRKNLPLLVEAFDSIAEEFADLSLVIAGKMGWHSEGFERALSAARFKDRIRLLGYVTEEQKQILLAGAAVVVYPSLYEGFGLPVLEAMALGVPVVTSNASSLPEVAGDAALLVDPASAAEIAEAIRRVLTDGELAARLVEAGPERARQFRWSGTAEKTYAAYRAVWRRS